MSKALLLIDIQNDYFQGGHFPLLQMKRAATNAAIVLNWARQAQLKIIHVRHEEVDPSADSFVPGSEGSEINELTTPLSQEVVLTKNFPNAFRETELAGELAGIDEVIVVGAMSNMCIDATARAAFDLGFQITIVEDACAASDLEFHGKTLQAVTVHGAFMAALASAYGTVLSTQEVVRGS